MISPAHKIAVNITLERRQAEALRSMPDFCLSSFVREQLNHQVLLPSGSIVTPKTIQRKQ